MYVFTDFGTSAKVIDKILLLYPKDKLHIINAESCLAYHQNLPDLVSFAKQNPMGLKLAAILQIADLGKPLLCSDTDVLWLNSPLQSIEQMLSDNVEIHMSYDLGPSYDFNLMQKAQLDAISTQPYYCAGIMFIKSISKSHRTMIDNLLQILKKESGHMSEQTVFAYLQKQAGASLMLPEQYFLGYADQFSLKPVFDQQCIARHYVGAVRHLFWRDAFAQKMWQFNIN